MIKIVRNERLTAIRQHLPETEEFQGAFYGTVQPALGWHFLLGSFAAFLMKTYIVALTDKKLYFAKHNLLGQVEALDGFEDAEIRQLNIKKNLFPGYTLKFEFGNGRKLKLKALTKHLVKSECQLTPELLTSLKERFQCL